MNHAITHIPKPAYSILDAKSIQPDTAIVKPNRRLVWRLAVALLVAILIGMGLAADVQIVDLIQILSMQKQTADAMERENKTEPKSTTENSNRRVNTTINNSVPVHAFRWR